MFNCRILQNGHGKILMLSVIAFLFLLAGVLPSLQVSASQVVSSNPSPASLCGSGYVATPDGCASQSCVHVISDPDALINTLPNGVTLVTYPNGLVQSFAPCNQGGKSSPAIDTNGWVEDAENVVHTKKMTGNWTVPSNPKSNDDQIIYMFDGTQNCVCDTAFIIQPVIQWGYNGAFGGAYWTFASWYCDSDCFYSTPINISVGDLLVGTLNQGKCVTKDSCAWKIVGKDATSGESTTLKLKGLSQQKYDFVTLEVYNVVSCSDYPTSGSTTFSHLLVNSKTIKAWTANVIINDGCGEKVVSTNGSVVTLDY